MDNNKDVSYVIMPHVGVNDDEAELVEWSISNKEEVSQGTVVAILETTKTAFEAQAEQGGYLIHLAEINEMIKVNEPVAVIVSDIEAGLIIQKEYSEKKKSEKDNDNDSDKKATKKAIELAKKQNINIDEIEISDGAIIRETDVQAVIDSKNKNENISIELKLDSNKESVAIFGAGQGGQTIRESLKASEKYIPTCFFDDSPSSSELDSLPVFHSSNLQEVFEKGVSSIAIAVTPGSLRRKIYHKLKDIGFEFINIIHPNTNISPSVEIGIGNHIKSGAVIETNTKIGDFCIIDNGVIIAHDNVIKDGCHLAPGVSLGSNINLSENCVIGIGSSISTGVSIGENSIVSVGSSVTSDVENNSIIEGVPAKAIGKSK